MALAPHLAQRLACLRRERHRQLHTAWLGVGRALRASAPAIRRLATITVMAALVPILLRPARHPQPWGPWIHAVLVSLAPWLRTAPPPPAAARHPSQPGRSA